MMEDRKHYLEDFASLKPNGLPQAFQKMRSEAFESFRAMDFPTTHEEDWRFTNVGPLAKIPFRSALLQTGLKSSIESVRRLLDRSGPWRSVWINGRPCEELSKLPPDLKAGLRIDEAQEHLGRSVPFDQNAFTALNTAFLHDGCFLFLPDGIALSEPVEVFHIIDRATDAAVFPRTLLVLGKGAQATVVESYLDLSGSRCFTNAVTEVVLHDGAVLQHIKVQRESRTGFHIATTGVRQSRDSSYTSLSVSLGAALARENLTTMLNGAGASCTLNGLYLTAGAQHVDHHTTIDHAQPHATSRELYKGILNEKSSAVFHGRIIVRKDAQHTDARQTNKNLLLSDSAKINTTPQLEILADDVKCNHGASIGHLDDDALFYLRSRGIADESARVMLMRGFLQEVTAQIADTSLRDALDEALVSRLAEFMEVRG